MKKEEIRKYIKQNQYWIKTAILSFLMLFTLLYVMHPFYNKIKMEINSFRLNWEKLTDAAEWQKNQDKIKALNRKYKEEIQKVKLGVSKEHKLSALFNLLNRSASQAEIQFESLKPGIEKEGKRSINIPFEIRIKNNYHRIGKFINLIENSGSIVKINNMQLLSEKLDKSDLDAEINFEFLVLK